MKIVIIFIAWVNVICALIVPPALKPGIRPIPSLWGQTLDGGVEESSNMYLATCIPGLAPVLAQELLDLGAIKVEPSGNSAVMFSGPNELGLKALLHVRTAHRLMELLAASEELVDSRDDIHRFIGEYIDVKNLLGNGEGGLLTISVSVVLNQKNKIPADINHSHYTALTIKNALCDTVRDLRGDRPSVDIDDADVPLVGVLRGTDQGGAEISLYRCLHPPGSLHRRGYRTNSAIHRAAMKESMAAGLLLLSGWKDLCHESKKTKERLTLVDPMAGSGSLILEAAMIAANVAPGLMRMKCRLPGHQIPPALRWKDGRDLVDYWKDLINEATKEAKAGMQWIASSGQIQIIVNDNHDGALDICKDSLRQAGFFSMVEFRFGSCEDLNIGRKCFVVTNPPWGVRLTTDMEESWESLRVFLRSCDAGTEAWILSGNKAATKHLGLKRSQSLVLKTAQQDLRWINYLIRERANSGSDGAGNIELDTKADFPASKVEQYARQESKSQEMFQQRKGSRPTSKATGYKSRYQNTRGQSKRSVQKKPRETDSLPLTDEERADRRNSWYI
mmetsp:Transcript_16640/g.25359  ORF Transcript_16640/g.25359 Transcript_16640/m.25359 type:complete len:561 (-) Transcript_16640:162-1844(-)